MFKSPLFFFTFAFTVVFQVATSNAQPDTLGPTLSFQGRLTTTAGEPMDSTDVGITFKLYKGIHEIWSESRTVDVVDGVFNVALDPQDMGSVLFNHGAFVHADQLAGNQTPGGKQAMAVYMRASHVYKLIVLVIIHQAQWRDWERPASGTRLRVFSSYKMVPGKATMCTPGTFFLI